MAEYIESVKYCPECGAETSVISSRENSDGTIRRRRECLLCGQRFTTREVFAGVDTRKGRKGKRRVEDAQRTHR